MSHRPHPGRWRRWRGFWTPGSGSVRPGAVDGVDLGAGHRAGWGARDRGVRGRGERHRAAPVGYITVWPSGTPRPQTSNLNFQAGQNIPNLVIVPVGADGKFQLYNGSPGAVHLIADVAGYILGGPPSTPGAVASLLPARILDTRIGQGAPGPVLSMGSISVQVTGQGGVPPTGVSAVAVNVTAAAPTAAGYITVWPSGTPRQETSNLNFQAGQNIPNLVIVPVGPDGKIQLYNGSPGTVHLIADVAGYILSG